MHSINSFNHKPWSRLSLLALAALLGACGDSSSTSDLDAGATDASADAGSDAAQSVAVGSFEFDDVTTTLTSAIVFVRTNPADARDITLWALASSTPGLSCANLDATSSAAASWPIATQASGIAGHPALVVGVGTSTSQIAVAAATEAGCVDGRCSVDLNNADLINSYIPDASCTVAPERANLADSATLTVRCDRPAADGLPALAFELTAPVCAR